MLTLSDGLEVVWVHTGQIMNLKDQRRQDRGHEINHKIWCAKSELEFLNNIYVKFIVLYFTWFTWIYRYLFFFSTKRFAITNVSLTPLPSPTFYVFIIKTVYTGHACDKIIIINLVL